jgi:hypothetical protein
LKKSATWISKEGMTMNKRRRRTGLRSSAEGERGRPSWTKLANQRAGLEEKRRQKEANLGKRRRTEEIGPVGVTNLEPRLS